MDAEVRVVRGLRGTVLLAVVALPLVLSPATLNAFSTPKVLVGWGLAAAAAAGAGVAGALRGHVVVGRRAVLLAVVGLLAVLTAAAAATPSSWRSLVGYHGRHVGVLAYLGGAVLMGVTASAFSRRSSDGELVTDHPLAGLLRAVLLAGVAVSAYGVLQVLGLEPLGWAAGGAPVRVISTLGNENFLAGWLAILGPVAVWGVLTGTWTAPWRIGCGVLAVVAFAVMVATASSQGPAAWLVGVAVLVAVRWVGGVADAEGASRRRVAGAVALSALAIGLAGAVLVPSGVVARVGEDVASSARDRVSLWETAVRIGAEHPVLGIGPDAFAEHYHRARPLRRALRYDEVRPGATQAHNVPLHLFAGAGAGALLAWVGWAAAVGAVGLAGLRRLEGERRLLLGAVLAAWCAYLTQAMVSIDVPALLGTGWVLAGAVLAASPRGPSRTLRLPPRRSAVPVRRAAVVGVTGVVLLGVALAGAGLGRFAVAELAAGAAARAPTAAAVEAAGRRADALLPWEPAYPNAAAAAWLRLDEPGRALASLDEVLRRAPASAPSHLDRMRLARQLGRLGEAAASARRLVELVPTTPGVLEEAADVLALAGDRAAADDLRARAADLRRVGGG